MPLVKKLTRKELNEKSLSLMDALHAKITKLDLKEGDIIVAPDHSVVQALLAVGQSWKGPKCPIIVCPGGVNTVTRAELLKLLESLPPDPSEARVVLAN